MKTLNLSLVLCLSMPMLAFAGNDATTAYPEMYEASAPAAKTANDDSSGTAAEKRLSAHLNEEFITKSDPVPMSDYVNGGHYAQ